MAWACRLGYTRRLHRGAGNGKCYLERAIIFVVLILMTFNFAKTLDFDCDLVKNCDCSSGYVEDEWEIQCPKGQHEDYDVTVKVKPLTNGNNREALLTVICNHVKPEISPGVIEGIDFKMAEDKDSSHNVTEILVQFCSASTRTNPNVLNSFFHEMNVPLENITSFVFLPSPKFITTFPPDFLRQLPRLEMLDLQKLNLSGIPDLSRLTELKELRLRDNRIEMINSPTFKTTSKLYHLDLSLNNLSTIPDNTLPESLRHLNLAGNKLQSISPETLGRLTLLQELVLTKNPLKNLSPETFSRAKALLILQLDSSQFEQFPKFQKLNLPELSISYRDASREREIPGRPSPLILTKGAERTNFHVVVTDMLNLTKIVFLRDGLKEFPHLENIPKLVNLNISENYIQVVPDQVFKQFLELRILDLSHNQIDQLADIDCPSLILLNLSFNRLQKLSAGVFSKLAKLESLQLGTNMIHAVDPKAFKSLSKLLIFDVSNNYLTFDDGKPKAEITNFGGDEGFLYEEFYYQSPLRFSMKLQRMDLSFNKIHTIFNDWKILFGELKLLNLSYNRIPSLEASTLSFSANDLILDISNNNISTINLDYADVILEDSANRVLRIFVDGNPLNCDCSIVAFKTFKLKGIYFKYKNLTCAEPRWLQGIQFREIPPTDLICPIDISLGCPSICNCWNVPANKTIAVDCSNRALADSYIPNVQAINGNWTRRYDYTLNLAGNNITDLDNDRSQNLSIRIAKIDLSENGLTSLAFLNNEKLGTNNVSAFYLAANKFSCDDCNFHKILRSRFKQVPDYNNVSCWLWTESAEGKQMKSYFVDEFPEDKVCMMNITAELQAMIVASSIFLVFLILFIGVYFRYGWALRAFLYSKGFGCCFGFDEIEDEQGKTFDAFISYSHKDEDWVLAQLVTRLEEQGFKLCLHFRDWTPGDWIPDQIVRSVDKSRRTIVILSKHFVESIWSRLEFKAAHSQALTEKANRLILVMMDEGLKDQDVKDDDLRVYMKMNTYLKYGDPWFWHKLKYALPHRKSISGEANLLKLQQHERAIQLDKIRSKMENKIVA